MEILRPFVICYRKKSCYVKTIKKNVKSQKVDVQERINVESSGNYYRFSEPIRKSGF